MGPDSSNKVLISDSINLLLKGGLGIIAYQALGSLVSGSKLQPVVVNLLLLEA